MEASRLHTRLPAPRLRSPGVLGGYLFASLALHGLVFGNQGTVGLGQSDAFTLDTMEPNPMVNIGLADSSGFELDTGGDDGTFRIGTDESSGFILNTLDSPSSIDLNQTGFSDSAGFRLDTKDGTLGFVGTMDTGFADSSIFSLDTSGGNAVAWDLNDTGYADSSGFQLDTRDDSLFGDSSFSDSAGFQLDTRETNEVVDRSYADSGSFQLDTGGHDGSLLFGFSDSGSFQLDTRNRDEVYNGDTNTSFADSSGFSLDTRDGDGGSNSTGGELVSVKGTIFYDGLVSGSVYVWAMEANGSKAAEDKISIGEGNYSILVEKGRAYDLKAFIDGNENGLLSTGEPWGHYGEWNNTANRYNLLQVDGNLTHVHFNLEDRDTDSDGFLDWVEVEAGTDENNASSFPNTSPYFQADGNLSVTENETFVFEFNASDPDVGTTLSYSILSGDDAGKFTLNTNTGGLAFTTAPDFESPDDNNSDNIYQLTVQVSDGENNATLDVSVKVLDVYEPSKANHTVDLNSTVNLEMIWVEPGTFTMGQSGNTFAEPEHEVTLTQGFYLGKYEVTQAQYEAVMTGNTETDSNGNVISATPSQYGGNLNRPVEKVSWDDIQVFLARLNDQQASNLPNGWAYVLPTEAQWEFACRAGTTTAYSWGDTINASDANWNHGNDANQTENAGQYNANPWGFFDMHGNVWEWTADAFGAYASGAQTDPFNAGTTDSLRSFRGGGWNNTGAGLSSASRTRSSSNDRIGDLGFRVGFQQVPDTASPELELFGGADIPHKRDEPWAEPGYGASDVRDGNLTSSVNISGMVDVNTTGTYTITYTVSDAAGNEANATRTVRVADESADTDRDGFNDYLETSSGSDVNDATSTPFNYGLLAWYPFDGNASDMSGNGNDLTGTGYSFGEDRHGLHGKSCRLDQVYLSNTNFSESIDDNISFSWSLWVKMNSVPSAYPFILAVNDSTGNSESLRVNILHQKDQGKFVIDHLATGTNSSSLVKAVAKQTNQIDRWYQLTMVSSVSEVKLYVDSALQSTVPFQRDALKNEKPAIYVGGHLSWNFFDGSIDDIRIYDRALSADEIGMLYQMEKTRQALDNSNFMTAVNMWFSDEANATATYGHISDWNTSAVTNMYQAFKDRASFNEDISKWDVSGVKNFSGFFRGAKSFNQDIISWDTSSATTFAEMFRDATSFNQAIGDWNVSSLLSLDKIFWSAAAFNQDLSNWDITGVNTMGHIFASADSLSEENKNLIHQTFSANSNWPYDWGITPNQAPQFQSDGNLSVEESQAFIYNFKALDADGDEVTYSLAGGDDKEFFKLNEATGGLSFIAPRDFEKPQDANTDNVYELIIEVGDSFENTALVLRVEVLDILEDDKGDPIDSVGFAPFAIEGLEMFARDDGWAIYEETITFDELGRFHAVITNGYDNPVAEGEYSYTKTGENTADLSYSVEGGFPFFQYSLTFTSELSGTYKKDEDYGDSSGFASGPFSFKATDNGPNTGGGGDGGVEAPESLAGLEVEIHFRELMPNGGYEDLGMERVTFGDFELSAFDANSQQIEYEPYIYKRISDTSALISLGPAGHEMEEINLTFKEAGFAEGTWIEMDEGEIFEGTLTFRIVDENKHSGGAGPGDDGGQPGTGSVTFITPSFISVQEKDEFVTNITASGGGGAYLMYSLVTGADALFFQLSPVTGRLSFLIPRDFHHPEDANLDNLYEVTIEATDGVNIGFLDLVVGILEVKEDPTDQDKPTDPNYPGGPGMDELLFMNPDFIEVEENMNYIAQIEASGLGGYSISYMLNGGLDQKFFDIDPFTGDLRFFTSRDYEWAEDANQDNLYELSIKASDGESSAVLDLVVGIIDMPEDPKEPPVPGEVLLPIVYTNSGEIAEKGEIHLSGRVLHDGGGKIEEVGFLLSPRLRIDPMGPETVRLPVHTQHDFSWQLDESPFPKRLYIQAYAVNEAGMNMGTIKRMKVPEPPVLWWGKVEEREGGWLQSPWFGDFKYYDHGWLFHSSLQWLFSSPVDGDGVWLWKDGMNWLWTGENIWPYMWSDDLGNWIYLPAGKPGAHSIYYDYSSPGYRNF